MIDVNAESFFLLPAMSTHPTIDHLYAAIEQAIPEPGINTTAVMTMLEKASTHSEGTVMFFLQLTSRMTRKIFLARHTFHTTINDYDFAKRVYDVLEAADAQE